jgi:2-polyprenyl-6-methoxyphenol hydroxylase-like FAD-dependent oxidoreductase
MLKGKKLSFLWLFFFLLTGNTILANPLSVVIVGGGPAGLAAAIIASSLDTKVTLIEKRSNYTRNNIIFLDEPILKLLASRGIEIPSMTLLDFQDQKRGFVLIKDLETGLLEKAKTLPIQMLQGQFKDFENSQKVLQLEVFGKEVFLPYDIVILADGAHSLSREKLQIPIETMGKAIGAIALISEQNPLDVHIEKKATDSFFVKKIQIPFASVLLMQIRPGVFAKSASRKELCEVALEVGWKPLVRALEATDSLILENIPILFQRAKTFSDPSRDALLLGDAACCTSFLDGMGVNTALQTCEFIAEFIKDFHSPIKAHARFNASMEKAVQIATDKNKHLF